MKKVYFVQLSWFEDDDFNHLRPDDKYYFFACGEDALELAHDIAYMEEAWKDFGSPVDVYIGKTYIAESRLEVYEVTPMGDEETTYLAMYNNCAKYIKH